MQLAIILFYLFGTLAVGYLFRRRTAGSRSDFYLAGRSLPPILLFVTMAASNFSAFTIFGLSGVGYRVGFAFFPIMGFGTGFMALSFWLIGSKILRLSKGQGYITPGDFIADRYGGVWLRRLFSGVLVLFTLPYVAIQTIAAGRSLESLAGIPYLAGACIVTLFIALYVALGGLRSIVWTDLIQGLMMLLFTLAGFLLILNFAGGMGSVTRQLADSTPGHLSRPGSGGGYSPGVWIGYLVLWFFADPMFPHLFQRFMAAGDQKSLRLTVILYPLITTGLFFLTVSIGVIGRVLIPGLSDAESDTIFPRLLSLTADPLLASLLLTGSLAALMSTLDSQLLTVTSILDCELNPSGRWGPGFRRLLILLIAVAGFVIALKPPQTLLGFINRTTFTGLAVLAPTVFGGLYWSRGNRFGAGASILIGEGLTLLFFFDLLEVSGTLPVVPVLLAATVAYVGGSLALQPGRENRPLPATASRIRFVRFLPVLGLFLLGNDFWNWGRSPRILLGLPGWVWYFILLGFLLSCAFRFLLASAGDTPSSP